jgi:hypothetical protein
MLHVEFGVFSTEDARVQNNKIWRSLESFTEVHRITHLTTITQNESDALSINGRMMAWRHAGDLAMQR